MRWNLKEGEGKLPVRGTRISFEASHKDKHAKQCEVQIAIKIVKGKLRRIDGRKVKKLIPRGLTQGFISLSNNEV